MGEKKERYLERGNWYEKENTIIIILLLSIFGFSLKADAAPATIKTTSLGKSSNLISGVPTVYVKQTTNSIYLYCEEALKNTLQI